MNILHTAYFAMIEFGIVKSANEFSRKLLGRSSRYYSWILATTHKPAIDVMVGLLLRLERLRDNATSSGDADMAVMLEDLVAKLWAEIRVESLAKRPASRKKRGPKCPPADILCGDAVPAQRRSVPSIAA